MIMSATKLSLIFLLSFVVLIPSRQANITDFDESYWNERAAESHKATLQAYEPNPEEVTDNLNYEVSKFVNLNQLSPIIIISFLIWFNFGT